jgi:hypothetical protein
MNGAFQPSGEVITTNLVTMLCFQPGPLDSRGSRIISEVYDVLIVTNSYDRGTAV